MLLKFISNFFGYYYLLFFLSFLSIYYLPAATPFINVPILLLSYYLILKRNRFDIILVLILYSRCINGFIIPHSKVAFDVINLLTNVVPVLLYFTGHLYLKKIRINRALLLRYRYATLFFILLTVSFIINLSTASDLITKRYLPFAFFMLFLLFFNRPGDFNTYGMIRFFRVTFLASVILYFGPDYVTKTQALMESDTVFGKASPPHSFSLIYFSFVRNMSFVWDHRIIAALSYLYLLLSLVHRPKYFTLDVLLSLVIVVTSTSRGGMITSVLIMAAYLFQVYRQKFTAAVIAGVVAMLLVLLFANLNASQHLSGFINSFNPRAKDNAISQREFFSNYALNAYSQSPVFGNGVGFLSSRLIERNLIVDGAHIPAVGDAYWYVLLAEMGLLGFVLYVLFLLEVFYSASILNVALLLGFAVQLLGTDIPDMRFFYFVLLVLVYQVNMQLRHNLLKAKPIRHEN